jgi:hypothetical protein
MATCHRCGPRVCWRVLSPNVKLPVRENHAVPQLNAWRRRSAVLSVLQVLLLVSVFAFVLVATVDAVVIVAATVALLLVEVLDVVCAHGALGVVAADYRSEAYARRPLRASDRRLVIVQLAGTIVVWILLLADLGIKSPQGERWVVAVALALAMVPGWLALARVLRKNSWLAVSRIPGPGRGRSPVKPDDGAA